MLRIVSLLPAILVAVIITVITSLYLQNLNELENISSTNAMMKEELQVKEKLLEESLSKIKDLERAALISKQSEKVIIEKQQVPEKPEKPSAPQSTGILNSRTVETKVNSIAKFIPLTENQRQRLEDKFTAELDPTGTSSEALEDIIGKENADFYREQRKNAFERVLKESIEKEILFIARKLNLQPAQEEAFRKTYFDIEDEIRAKRDDSSQQPKNSASTLEKLVLEEKERNRLLAERLKTILDEAQYQEFIKYQSGSQDMQLWHEK